MSDGITRGTNGTTCAENALMPCWHCGVEPKVVQADHPSYTPHGEGWYVICKCGATLGYHGTDELYMTYGDFASELSAIEAWNTRVAVTDYDFSMAVHDGRLGVRVVRPTWSESDKYRCECGEQLHGFRHRCPACGGWVDYDGVGPKAVLG